MSAASMLDAALDVERPVEPTVSPPGGGSGDGSEQPDGICVATLPSGCALIRDTTPGPTPASVNHHAR